MHCAVAYRLDDAPTASDQIAAVRDSRTLDEQVQDVWHAAFAMAGGEWLREARVFGRAECEEMALRLLAVGMGRASRGEA